MIVELTLKCMEGCTHCFVNASPSGQDMALGTLTKTIRLLKKIAPRVLQVSGGEFTLHETFSIFCAAICNELPETSIVLESNGWWFDNEQVKAKILELLKRRNVHTLQIRTDERYYPNYTRIWSNREKIEAIHPKIKVFEGAIELIPLGRAKNLITENPEKSPMCANIMMLNRQVRYASLHEMVFQLEQFGKFSTPSIDPRGVIHIGESCLCASIGTVEDNPAVLLKRIQAYEFCGACNLSINPRHLKPVNT